MGLCAYIGTFFEDRRRPSLFEAGRTAWDNKATTYPCSAYPNSPAATYCYLTSAKLIRHAPDRAYNAGMKTIAFTLQTRRVFAEGITRAPSPLIFRDDNYLADLPAEASAKAEARPVGGPTVTSAPASTD